MYWICVLLAQVTARDRFVKTQGSRQGKAGLKAKEKGGRDRGD